MKSLVLGFFLIFSTSLHADDDTVITEWTKQALVDTLSIDYNYQSSDSPRKGFSLNAWNALRDFLDDYVQVIRDKKLTLHPSFLLGPTIVDSGQGTGIHYWRVNEEILFPEIHIKVAFSLLLIATVPSTNSTYIIQNMDIVKQENP